MLDFKKYVGGLGSQLTAKIEAMKQSSAGLGKAIKMHSSKVCSKI